QYPLATGPTESRIADGELPRWTRRPQRRARGAARVDRSPIAPDRAGRPTSGARRQTLFSLRGERAMSRGLQRAALIAAGVVVIGVSIAVGYQWAKRGGHDDSSMAADPAAVGGSKVLYWYDPMVPNQHFDKPGKSPFMDMALQPKYADQGGADSTGIRVDASTQQNLGLRLAPVERGPLDTAINAVGTVGFNERELAIVQARTNGFVSRVYARAPGDVVLRGAPLVDLLVPEWAGAQQEFIALRRSNDVPLVEAARDRLKLLGMPDAVIRHVEQTGQAQTTVTITAPIAGVIQTLEARAGMTIATGMTLAQINALRTVWLSVAVRGRARSDWRQRGCRRRPQRASCGGGWQRGEARDCGAPASREGQSHARGAGGARQSRRPSTAGAIRPGSDTQRPSGGRVDDPFGSGDSQRYTHRRDSDRSQSVSACRCPDRT